MKLRYDIHQAEVVLKNYLLDGIRNHSKRGIFETDEDVLGTKCYDIFFDIYKAEYIEKQYPLDSLYVSAKIPIPFPMNQIDNICNQLVEQIQAKEDEFIKGHNLLYITCRQLCDWTWLEDETGHILRHETNDKKDIYTATLVKYCKYLDKEGNEL